MFLLLLFYWHTVCERALVGVVITIIKTCICELSMNLVSTVLHVFIHDVLFGFFLILRSDNDVKPNQRATRLPIPTAENTDT